MHDFENLDHYQILGIPRSATPEEIKKAYRREIAHYHPDHYQKAAPEEQTYARARSQRITEAYRVLNDFSSRTKYNAEMATPTAHPSSASSSPTSRFEQLDTFYVQAEKLLRDGRPKEALEVLKRMEQIDPFYRDSAELRWRAETRANPHGASRGPRRTTLLAIGGVALALVLLFVWLSSRGDESDKPTPTQSALVPILASVTPEPGAATPELTATVEAVAQVSETAAPASATVEAASPTEATSPTEAASPTAAASPTEETSSTAAASSTPKPSATSAAPTATTRPAVPADLSGEILVEDTFDVQNWPTGQQATWLLNYQGGEYHMKMSSGVNTLWSYSSTAPPSGNIAISVDVGPQQGFGGILFGFVDGNNHYRLMTTAAGDYKLEQRSGGTTYRLTEGDGAGNGVLSVALDGAVARIYFNNTLLDEVELGGVPRGGFGFVIGSIGAAESFFDNLRIRRLE